MKTLEELEQHAKNKGYAGIEHAINLVETYSRAYSEYLDKYRHMEKVFNALREVLPSSVMQLVDERLKELEEKGE